MMYNTLHRLLYYMGKYWPITKGDLLLFYSNPPLSDNAYALYKYILLKKIDKKYNLNMIWLTSSKRDEEILRQKGLIVYRKASIKGIIKILNAKVYLFSHLPTNYRLGLIKGRGTHAVYLNHGLPFKGSNYEPNHIAHYFLDIDACITTSRLMAYIQGGWHGVHSGKCAVTGYPRNDVLLEPGSRKRAELLLRNLGIDVSDEVKVLLYAPTFRYHCGPKRDRCEKPLRVDGRPFEGLLPMKESEIKTLDKILTDNDAILIIRYHPGEEPYRKTVVKNILKRYKRIFVIFSNKFIKNNITLYDVLPRVDLLITDYSSIYYDFLLLDRPILFYMYDLREYSASRRLILEEDSVRYWLPGPLIENSKQFIESLRSHLEGFDDYRSERHRLLVLTHYYRDNESSRRVWERVVKPLL